MRRPIALRFLNVVVNPLVRGVLRSRAHRVFSGKLLLIEMVGVRSGCALSLPVAYQQTSPDELRVHVGGWEHKVWWRNLREPTKVTVWLRGDEMAATGLARKDLGTVDVVLGLERRGRHAAATG
jgi:hypothetical protein